ncbi:hypothetical protein ACP4OV_017011 [Aristida adscensionis]
MLRREASGTKHCVEAFIHSPRRRVIAIPLHLPHALSSTSHTHRSTIPATEPDMDQTQQQQHGSRAHAGGDAPAAAHAQAQQQHAAGPDKQQQQQQQEKQEASSLNPTAARLLREAIVSRPEGERAAAATAAGSSDILAFARSVDRVDSALE